MRFYTKWVKENCRSLDGKTVLITGASGSIGYFIAFYCLALGADLIFGVRNKQKAENSKANLMKDFPNAKIEIKYVDFEKLETIKAFYDEIKHTKVDFLVNNAGIFLKEECKIEHDLERLFCINYLGQYYFTKLMINDIKDRGGKIVTTSSISAYFPGTLNLKNLQNLGIKIGLKRYSYSKKLVTYSCSYLNEKYGIVDMAHPGVSYSGLFLNLSVGLGKFFSRFLEMACKLIFMSNSKASLPIIYALTNDIGFGNWVGPRGFLQFWGQPKIYKLKNRFFNKKVQNEIINKTDSLLREIGLE